jgi:hypothetical protein
MTRSTLLAPESFAWPQTHPSPSFARRHNDIERFSLHRGQRLAAIRRHRHLVSASLQQANRELLINLVIFRQMDAQSLLAAPEWAPDTDVGPARAPFSVRIRNMVSSSSD